MNIGVLIISILFFIVAVLSIVFNGVAIGLWNKTPEEFNLRKGFSITAVVFDFLVVIAGVVLMCLGSSAWVIIILVLAMLLSLASAILLLVDICLENGRVNKKENQVASQQTAVSATKDAKLTSAETFEKKLAKLNAMKEHGVITEEEYSEIKKSYVKEFLG